MRPSLAPALIAALWLGATLPGCTPFPDLDDTITDEARRAPFPALVPLDSLQTRIADTRIEPGTAQSVEARADRLRARAARLDGAVIDSGTRARMRAGVQQ